MTTVIDPAGTPVPVYNKSGKTLVHVTPVGNTQAAAAEIPHHSGTTIVVVDCDQDFPNERAVRLPSSADIGDLVEVSGQEINGMGFSNGIKVCAPTGGKLNNATGADVVYQSDDGFGSFRKIASDNWVSSGV